MKTTRSAAKTKARNIKTLAAALNLCDQSLKGSRGDERVRIQGEIETIRARLRELGA